MKLVHISDIHIHHEPLFGFDPVARFSACLAHVAEHQSDADLVVISGDLTHRGLEPSYRTLKSMLESGPLQGALRPRLMVGNHDDRSAMRRVFPESADDGHGYLQWSEETEAGTFLYLDTAEPGTHAGHYREDRRAWLEAQLEKAASSGRAVYIVMHHNPVAVHVANADRIGIVEHAELLALLKNYRRTIRHIFFGHCHFTLSGSLAGIPFSAPRATNHVCWPDFSGIAERMGYGDFSPNYCVCCIEEDSIVVHSIDFLEQDKVLWRLDP